MFRWLLIICVFVVGLFGINLKSFFTYTFDPNKKYDGSKARDLYFKNKCNVCHGDNGEKSITGSRILKDMSAVDIKAALVAYTLDPGTSAGAIEMAFYASKLSHGDMDKIIAYIKGEDFAIWENLLEKDPPQKTKHNIFLK